jgi:hypothetical protein
MRSGKTDLENVILEFYKMLKTYEDSPKSLSLYTNFIREFLRTKTYDMDLPTTEVITVLKTEKPLVFSLMRKNSDSILRIITNLEMDYEEAQQHLKQFLNT